MTLDEAKQLKPGDRVLIEAEVVHGIDEDFDVYLALKSTVDEKELCEFLPFTYIKKRGMPPSRKFREGDIVRVADSRLKYVIQDEDDYGVLIADHDDDKYGCLEDPCGVSLVCPVENRMDFKRREV